MTQEDFFLKDSKGVDDTAGEAGEANAPVVLNVSTNRHAADYSGYRNGTNSSVGAIDDPPKKASSIKTDRSTFAKTAATSQRTRISSRRSPQNKAVVDQVKSFWSKLSATISKMSHGLFSKPESKSLQKTAIIVIAIFVVFDIIFFSYLFFLLRGGAAVYDTDPSTVIARHIITEGNIKEIAYDSGNVLSFSNFGAEQKYNDLSIVNTSSLKKIDNNTFKAYASDKDPLLYDDLVVGRIMTLNDNWVDYRNLNDPSVFNSIVAGSSAEKKVTDWGASYSNVTYTKLVFGELRHFGKDYFIVTEATYTFYAGNELYPQNDIIVFKLSEEGETLKVVDFEIVPVIEDVPNG